MSTTARALFSPQLGSERWRVFVTLPEVDPASWPQFGWQTAVIPTPAERLAALADLGYQPVPGAQWEWTEGAPEATPTRAVAAVFLFAAVTVQPVGGELQ